MAVTPGDHAPRRRGPPRAVPDGPPALGLRPSSRNTPRPQPPQASSPSLPSSSSRPGSLAVAQQHIRPAPLRRPPHPGTPGPPADTARARGDVVGRTTGGPCAGGTRAWAAVRSTCCPRGKRSPSGTTGSSQSTDGRSVRWHRAPARGGRVAAHRAAAGVLRPLGRGMLAVVAARIAAYRTADGDLRWVLPARAGCAFRPERAVRHGRALLVAQPCAHGAWTAQRSPWTTQAESLRTAHHWATTGPARASRTPRAPKSACAGPLDLAHGHSPRALDGGNVLSRPPPTTPL
ncbi:hypothetical protein ACRAWF_35450 [Streptomyces sp. L7]